MLTSAIPPHQAGLAVVESRCPTHLQARLQRQDPARVTPRTPDAATAVSACSRTGSWVPPITITSSPVTSGAGAVRASRSTDSPPARKYSGPAAAAATVTTATTSTASDTPRRNHSARATNVRLGTDTHASSPSRPRPAAAATPPEVSNRPQPRLPRACNTHPQDGSTRRDLRCLGGAHHRTAAVPGVRVARPRAGSWAADHHPALLGQWPSVHLPGHHLAGLPKIMSTRGAESAL